jgi:signal transduction histidine kinase
MKLLTRTSVYYFAFSLLIFILAGFIFFHVIQSLFYKQIDETLVTEKKLIIEQINFSDSIPDFRTVFGHMIEVTIYNSPRIEQENIKDTMVFDNDKSEMVLCRHLIATNTSIKTKGYVISIFKPIDETKNLITAILLAMTILFISLIALLLLVNYFISKRVWVPFYRTLRNLANYDINKDEPLLLTGSTIKEFQSLNEALGRMSKKLRRDYLNLKEFNENASHELQTPLAVIKSKVELLVQNEQMSDEQMQLIHSVYDAASRMTKLNQGLLLISKIENNQFRMTEEVNFKKLIENNLIHFEELIRMKGITLSFDCVDSVKIFMNKTLSEILVSNLISNAIRHNIEDGQILIHLDNTCFKISNSGQPLTVPPQNLFQRFSKSDRHTESVGLGLAIVKQIVTLYQLDITYTYNNGFHNVNVTFHHG